jgi:hypothetical protein
MTVVLLPELLDFLDGQSGSPYLYNKTFVEARQDPFVVLHTSGSTGLPKPIIVPNGSLATPDAHHLLPPVEGRLTQAQYFTNPHQAYSTFPNFHLSLPTFLSYMGLTAFNSLLEWYGVLHFLSFTSLASCWASCGSGESRSRELHVRSRQCRWVLPCPLNIRRDLKISKIS